MFRYNASLLLWNSLQNSSMHTKIIPLQFLCKNNRRCRKASCTCIWIRVEYIITSVQSYSYHHLLASRSALKHMMILCSDLLCGEGLCLSSSVWLGNLNTFNLVLWDSEFQFYLIYLDWLFTTRTQIFSFLQIILSLKNKRLCFLSNFNKSNLIFNVLNIICLKFSNKVI